MVGYKCVKSESSRYELQRALGRAREENDRTWRRGGFIPDLGDNQGMTACLIISHLSISTMFHCPITQRAFRAGSVLPTPLPMHSGHFRHSLVPMLQSPEIGACIPDP
jgi:hypothetical protein